MKPTNEADIERKASLCGLEYCNCGYTIDKLVKVLEAVTVRDDVDGLWLLFNNGRQKGAVNTHSPGPIVRTAILGWFGQVNAAIKEAKS